jgi:hypothetical protein
VYTFLSLAVYFKELPCSSFGILINVPRTFFNWLTAVGLGAGFGLAAALGLTTALGFAIILGACFFFGVSIDISY